MSYWQRFILILRQLDDFLIDYRFMTRSDDGKQYWIESESHVNT